jgi:fructose-1,6-bisphosphatase I
VYVCSLVADVHYVLQRGGMACNPRSHLRLIYEGSPMALVVEEAGGLSSTGGGPRERRILDVAPQAIHERIPTFVGSTLDILELESYGDVAQEGSKTYGSVQVNA